MRQSTLIVLFVPLVLGWPAAGQTQQVQSYPLHASHVSHSSTHVAHQHQLQPKKSRGDELLLGVASPLASAIFFPIKLSVGTLGSALSGVSGFMTGGSERAAEGIWWPTVRGHYFVTPEVLEGKETLFPPDPQPVVRRIGLIRSEAYIQDTARPTMQSATLMPVSSPAQQQASQARRASVESALHAAQAASEEAQQAARAAQNAAEKSVRAAERSMLK